MIKFKEETSRNCVLQNIIAVDKRVRYTSVDGTLFAQVMEPHLNGWYNVGGSEPDPRRRLSCKNDQKLRCIFRAEKDQIMITLWE